MPGTDTQLHNNSKVLDALQFTTIRSCPYGIMVVERLGTYQAKNQSIDMVIPL